MKGKDKCKALKEIRRQIAEKNDIPYVVSQCKYQGDCLGTCPKCEAELKYLERELAIRQGLGKAAAVAGISISVCAFLTACASGAKENTPDNGGYEDLAGNVEIAPDPADETAPETNTKTPEDTESDVLKETEQNSPEEKCEPEIEGKVEKTEGTDGEVNIDDTTGPFDTDDLTGDIDIAPEN